MIVESKKKKGGPSDLNHGSLITSLMKEPASQPDTLLTPNKAEKNSLEKDLGSTQLRKTVFKKHYMEKSKNTGEPSTMKGSYDNRNPYTTGQKRPPDEER